MFHFVLFWILGWFFFFKITQKDQGQEDDGKIQNMFPAENRVCSSPSLAACRKASGCRVTHTILMMALLLWTEPTVFKAYIGFRNSYSSVLQSFYYKYMLFWHSLVSIGGFGIFFLVHWKFVPREDFNKADGYSEGSRSESRKGMWVEDNEKISFKVWSSSSHCKIHTDLSWSQNRMVNKGMNN